MFEYGGNHDVGAAEAAAYVEGLLDDRRLSPEALETVTTLLREAVHRSVHLILVCSRARCAVAAEGLELQQMEVGRLQRRATDLLEEQGLYLTDATAVVNKILYLLMVQPGYDRHLLMSRAGAN